MPAYDPHFSEGTAITIKSKESLERFKARWKWHHPLQAEQLEYAAMTSRVTRVSFYHGGDCLYELEGVPGFWHEECLEADGVAKQASTP